MKVGILTIGDEILIGQTINTNAAWLGIKLSEAGFEVGYHLSVSDKEKDILEGVDFLFKQHQLIICTGGLGPTKDDITKEVLVNYFNDELVFNDEAFDRITQRFKTRPEAIERSRYVAMLPKNALIFPNSRGTASGMLFKNNNNTLISLPGVPNEMHALFEEHLLPHVQTFLDSKRFYQKSLITIGIGETKIAELIDDIETQLPENMSIAYLPQMGWVKLRIGITRNDQASATDKLEKTVLGIKAILKGYVLSETDENIEQVVGKMLTSKGLTIATAESCTGGNIAKRIVSVSGSSAYYQGSFISYSYQSKSTILGVNHDDIVRDGAVSETVVEQMALGLKKKLSVDFAIAVSGIAGPNGGTDDKPVGTVWIAIANPKGIYSKRFQFTDNREDNIELSTVTALNLVRLILLGKLKMH